VEVLEQVKRAAEKSTVKLWPVKQLSTAGPVVATANGVCGISLVGRIGRKPFCVDTDRFKKHVS
jgi:hypothetical protein